MSTKKALLIGCGLILLLGVAVIAFLAVGVYYVAQDVEGVAVRVETPLDVTAKQEFDLVVHIENQRTKKAISLQNVDIGGAYLDGFTVLSVDPNPESSMQIPLDTGMSYTFNRKIPVGETFSPKFHLRAESAGILRGDIDVYEGMRCITTMAQTVVKEKAEK